MTTLKPGAFAAAVNVAERIEELPYVTGTIRLPDLHMKDGMEAPSSLVVATRDVIVPHLVSESINDGMGLIATDVSIDDVTIDQVTAILRLINAEGARTKAKPGRYSWSPELLEAACRQGAEPLLANYGLGASFLDRIEDRGSALPRELNRDEFLSAVPRYLRQTKLTRSEIGLNFAGNHFLEVQVVDEIVDESAAAQWNLTPGQVMIMYHLGPGPLGSILSNLYAFRSKPQLHRKVGYAFFRNVLHLKNGREYHKTFAALNQWLTLDPESEQGLAYANVLRVIKNYGFAYRTATMRAIIDAVHEVTGSPPDSNELIVDMSHNMLQPEEISNQNFWVSRHNCCRPKPGVPGIVAGNHQVSSCVTIGPPGCDRTLAGYDHGVGFLIEEAQQKGLLETDPRGLMVRRLWMTRGTQRLHEQEVLPLLGRTPLDSAMRTLSADGMALPVALLRPLATLKHRT